MMLTGMIKVSERTSKIQRCAGHGQDDEKSDEVSEDPWVAMIMDRLIIKVSEQTSRI